MVEQQICERVKKTLKIYDLLIKKSGGHIPWDELEKMTAADLLITLGPNLDHLTTEDLTVPLGQVLIPLDLIQDAISTMGLLANELRYKDQSSVLTHGHPTVSPPSTQGFQMMDKLEQYINLHLEKEY